MKFNNILSQKIIVVWGLFEWKLLKIKNKVPLYTSMCLLKEYFSGLLFDLLKQQKDKDHWKHTRKELLRILIEVSIVELKYGLKTGN